MQWRVQTWLVNEAEGNDNVEETGMRWWEERALGKWGIKTGQCVSGGHQLIYKYTDRQSSTMRKPHHLKLLYGSVHNYKTCHWCENYKVYGCLSGYLDNT